MLLESAWDPARQAACISSRAKGRAVLILWRCPGCGCMHGQREPSRRPSAPWLSRLSGCGTIASSDHAQHASWLASLPAHPSRSSCPPAGPGIGGAVKELWKGKKD